MVLVKNYLKRLSRIFAYRIFNYFPFVLICVLLFIELVINKRYFNIIFLIPLLIITFIKNKPLLTFIGIIFIIIGCNYFIHTINYNSIPFGNVEQIVKVIKVTSYDDYQKVIIKINRTKINYINKNNNLSAGDIIYINGKIEPALKEQLPGEFDYLNYLKNNNIKGILKANEIKKIGHKFSIYRPNELVVNYIKSHYHKNSALFINALLFGDKSNMNDDLEKQIQTLGIGHLFVVSGLHVSIIVGFLSFVIDKLRLGEKLKFIIVTIALSIYYILCGLLISVLRVLLGIILGHFFKFKTSTDKLCCNALIVLLINPFYITNYSFLLSYTIVFGITLISKYLKEGNFLVSLRNQLCISALGLIISLPITASISYQVNLLSIIFNIFYIPFVTYIFLPASIICLIIRPLEYIYNLIIKLFLFCTKNLSKLSVLIFDVPKMNYYCGLIFFATVILFFFLKRKKYICLLIGLIELFVLNSIVIVNPYLYIYFMSVYNGDCTLIQDSFNRANILIDTGDKGCDEVITFLKHRNINSLDAVIITHGDSDHCGMIGELNRNFKIKNIYISGTDKVLKYKLNKQGLNYIEVFKNQKLKIKNNEFFFLHPDKEYENINNNSLVFIYKYKDLKILFTGDMEKEVEKILFRRAKYNVDILKIPHHGSNTSSTDYLFKGVKFDYAIAMNGYGGKFDFPEPSIRKKYESLKNAKVYFTKDHGTIYIKKFCFNKLYKIYSCY